MKRDDGKISNVTLITPMIFYLTHIHGVVIEMCKTDHTMLQVQHIRCQGFM